jgi:hypothetical protein
MQPPVSFGCLSHRGRGASVEIADAAEADAVYIGLMKVEKDAEIATPGGKPAIQRRGRRGFRRLGPSAWAALALLAALLGAPAAFAQDDPFSWFTHLFQTSPATPSHVMKRKPAVDRPAQKRVAARPRPEARPALRPRERPVESAGGKPPAAAAVAPTFFVAVLGDSLGQMLAQGLTEAFADQPEVAILREAKENSGLVRDDFYDWTKVAQDLLASGRQIDFAVMMIGSNDRQPLRDGKGDTFEPRSPAWEEAYAHRIEAIAAMFRDRKIPLLWVGLPVLKSQRLSADANAFNDLYRANAGKAGATYVDVWEAFANDAGEYSATGPNIDGQIVKLRASDGVHFTVAGARKLAHFVEPDIRRKLDEMKQQQSPESPAISAPAEASLPAQEPAANAPAANAPSETAPPAAPPAPPPRPIAGPVLPLTGPVRAPGGELAARASATQAAARPQPADRPGEPRPGRADDFSWPRP